jgi:hypothetical protein
MFLTWLQNGCASSICMQFCYSLLSEACFVCPYGKGKGTKRLLLHLVQTESPDPQPFREDQRGRRTRGYALLLLLLVLVESVLFFDFVMLDSHAVCSRVGGSFGEALLVDIS